MDPFKEEHEIPRRRAIKRIIELRLQVDEKGRGYGPPRIAEILNAEGHRGKDNTLWHANSVVRAIKVAGGLGPMPRTIWALCPNPPPIGAKWEGKWHDMPMAGTVLHYGRGNQILVRLT